MRQLLEELIADDGGLIRRRLDKQRAGELRGQHGERSRRHPHHHQDRLRHLGDRQRLVDVLRPADGAKAYFDSVNAAGGVNGRKILVVTEDDQSSPAGTWPPPSSCSARTSTPWSASAPTTSAATRHQPGQPPHTGWGFDGPEWATAPQHVHHHRWDNRGRTSSDTRLAGFFKIIGVTNIGGLAYGISPSSTAVIKDMKTALEKIGLKMGYENLSVPFGGVDVTAPHTGHEERRHRRGRLLVRAVDQPGHVHRPAPAGLERRSRCRLRRPTRACSPTHCGRRPGCLLQSQIPPLDQNNPATNTMSPT